MQITNAHGNNRPNVDADRPTSAGSRYHSYDVRLLDSNPNNYLPGNQGAVGGDDFPDRAYRPASGFQGDHNQAVSTGIYQSAIDGQIRTFTSLGALLRIQRFMDNFKARAEVYLPDLDNIPEDSELKTLILQDEYIQRMFLFVNEIETLNGSVSADLTPLTEQASASGVDACYLPEPSPTPRSNQRRSVSHENHQINLIPGGQGSPEQLSSEYSNPASAVNSSPQYSCYVNGEHKSFGSIDALLAEQNLLQNFRDSAELYNVSSGIPANDVDLKNFIKNVQERINVFLFINDIKTVPTANPEPISTIYNHRMKGKIERVYSFILHRAGRSAGFLDNYPRANKHTFKLSEAGFYLSLKRKKTVLFLLRRFN